MTSERKIASNRRNAENSTGPRSVEGKARSSMNALKTGIYAAGAIIRGESSIALQQLTSQFHAEYHPVTPTECSLVDTLVQSEWTLRRCRWLETEVWRTATAGLTPDERDISLMGSAFTRQPSIARVHRLRNSAQRQFLEALNALLRLRQLDHAAVDPIPVPAPLTLIRDETFGPDDVPDTPDAPGSPGLDDPGGPSPEPSPEPAVLAPDAQPHEETAAQTIDDPACYPEFGFVPQNCQQSPAGVLESPLSAPDFRSSGPEEVA